MAAIYCLHVEKKTTRWQEWARTPPACGARSWQADGRLEVGNDGRDCPGSHEEVRMDEGAEDAVWLAVYNDVALTQHYLHHVTQGIVARGPGLDGQPRG